MSRFYQRYLGTANPQHKAGSQKQDVTSMSTTKRQEAAPGRDNNKAPTVPSKGRRVEVFNNPDEFRPAEEEIPVVQKDEAAKRFLFSSLFEHYLFESVDPEDLERLVDRMNPFAVSAGQNIINQGDEGDLFYCLDTGTATANVAGVGEVMKYDKAGSCFGELALIYNCPRAATVTAVTDCTMWTLDLKTFRQVLATSSSNSMVKRCEFLKKCKFLEPLTNEMIGKLAGALEVVEFKTGDYIIRQGDHGDRFFIIEDGTVRCTQIKATGREVELITLKTGDYFGEMALILNESRHANVIASGECKCLSLNKEKFELLLGSVTNKLIQRMRIRILQGVPLLAKLPENKLMKLSSVMRVQAFEPGQYIIRQGDEGSRFYIINEGEVRCTRIPEGSKEEEELIRLHPQEFFGERALITNEVRKANVIAVCHTECLVLERSSFQGLLTEVQEALVEEMTKREEATSPRSKPEEETVTQTDYKFDDLRVMRTLGTGTFGRVKLIQHIPTGEVCALKCMNKTEVIAAHQQNNIFAEKGLLFECSRCPFVLKLLQTYNFSNQIMMLMEFLQGGEMWSYIYDKKEFVPRGRGGGFDVPSSKFYAANIILAFKFIHAKNIAYRDLKPENLLLDSKGYVKVIDFGFAKKMPYVSKGKTYDKTYTLCGTPEYLAPEIIMSKGYDKAVDYWALGCLIYELIYARTPFADDYHTKVFKKIVASEKTLQFPAGADPKHVALVKKLLAQNPSFRMGNLSNGIADLTGDPYFAEIDWDAITSGNVKAPFVPNVKNPLDASNFDQYEEDDHIPRFTGDQGLFTDF